MARLPYAAHSAQPDEALRRARTPSPTVVPVPVGEVLADADRRAGSGLLRLLAATVIVAELQADGGER